MSDGAMLQDNGRPQNAYYVLGVLTLVYAFNFIDRQLLAILQESIKAELLISDQQLGLLTGFAFALFYVCAGIPIARWADKGNRKNIVALALFVWSFMTAISGMVQNYVQLLLARIGVGIGEAGGSPPSHSIISDVFPVEKRASAMGFYSTGVSFGILFGFLLGGWINEFFGWRVAFLVVGAPGILLALLVKFSLKEPLRGMSESRQAEDAVPLAEVLRLLRSRKTFIHLSLGSALTAFASYASANWSASFIIRSHGMSTGELGTWLAIIMGLCGGLGAFFGGVLADKWAKRNQRWYCWLPALAALLSVPFLIATYLMPNAYWALLMMVVPGLMSNVYLGSTIATCHRLVGLRMRALCSAVLFFVLNIIGLGLGPWLVGLGSDLLADRFAQDSLRYSLLIFLPPVMLWSASHFYLASRSLETDIKSAPA